MSQLGRTDAPPVPPPGMLPPMPPRPQPGFARTHPAGRALARTLRACASASQPLMMLVLLVVWKGFDVPFWTAAERCFVAGLAIYTLLAALASLLLTAARLQPFALFARDLTRLASVLVFAALRYL